MKNLILFFAVMLFTLMACQKENVSVPTVSDEDLSLRSAPRPFRATIDFVLTLGSDDVICESPKVRLGFEGDGNALHMGKILGKFNHCIAPGIGNTLTDGAGVMTAANGDEVHVAYEAVISRAGNQTFVNGSYTITGGTGRFDGATGEGSLDAVQELIPPFYPGEAEFEGEINY